jgi:hypothetical protein
MAHPWCKDIERDLAVRAAEDAAPRPALPDWSELPKRVAALEAAIAVLAAVTKSQSAIHASEETSQQPLLTAEERAALRAFLPLVRLNNPILDGHADAIRLLLARAGGR